MFECDPEWINALLKTFEPWKKKIFIVNKFVSDINNNKYITLDTFFNEKKINFIKADIEGMEINLLNGMRQLFNNSNLKLLLCTYHNKNDAIEIQSILENNKFTTEYSKGYMITYFDKFLEEPYIRRGVIRAFKKI